MHVAKFTKAQTGHILNHCNRDKEAPCNRSNERIDPERTGQNYNLMEREQSPQEYLTQRLGEVYHMDRDNINVMCDWVVTLPKDFDGDSRDFFIHTVDFLNERYGGENCIGAFVHMDETTPHLHYSFMPVTEDKNPKHEQDYKLNAKEVIDRQELKDIHPDLQKYLRERMPDKTINVDLKDGQKRNRTLEEHKAFMEQQRIDKLKEDIRRQEIDLEARKRDLERGRSEVDRQQQQQERYYAYFERVEGYKARCDMSDREYFMACWNADNGRSKYPEPERYNPERSDLGNSRFERIGPERSDHEKDYSPER